MNIKLIYSRLICGGIGYSPLLFKINRKYYTVLGDTEPDNYRKLSAMEFHQKRDGHSLWIRHNQDNVVTAGEFLEIIKAQK